MLGNLLQLPGFDFETSEAVRDAALGDLATLAQRLDNSTSVATVATVATVAIDTSAPAASGLQRVADVPIYATDATVRRAVPLQLTADARAPMVGLPTSLWQQLGLVPGAQVRVTQGQGSAVLAAREDTTLAEGAVRIAAGHPSTAALGAMFGTVTVEKA